MPPVRSQFASAYLSALQAVDKNTLLQLKGQAARGYAFDRRYGMDDTSNDIFKDCVEGLVNNVFKVSPPCNV